MMKEVAKTVCLIIFCVMVATTNMKAWRKNDYMRLLYEVLAWSSLITAIVLWD